jgi:hypothetical protein
MFEIRDSARRASHDQRPTVVVTEPTEPAQPNDI